MRQVQYILRQFPFVQFKLSVAEKWNHPVCEICEFAKACHRPKQSLNRTKHDTHDGSLKIGDLRPGSTISVDHFESRLLEHTFNSYGSPSADKFGGGCLDFSMLSIKLASLQWRISGQN